VIAPVDDYSQSRAAVSAKSILTSWFIARTDSRRCSVRGGGEARANGSLEARPTWPSSKRRTLEVTAVPQLFTVLSVQLVCRGKTPLSLSEPRRWVQSYIYRACSAYLCSAPCDAVLRDLKAQDPPSRACFDSHLTGLRRAARRGGSHSLTALQFRITASNRPQSCER